MAKNEQKLRKSEARYRNVIEVQTELISRFRPDGTHVFANEAYYRYFGKSREKLTNRIFIPDIPEEDRENVKLHFASLTPLYPIASIEHRIILPGGIVRWQRWNDRAIFDENGTVIEFQSVGMDVTDRRMAEEALRRANRQLNLMTNITRHDILNKVTVILGYLHLGKKTVPPQILEPYISKLECETKAIRSQIEFTKIYQKLGSLEPQWQDPTELIARLAVPAEINFASALQGTEIYADAMFEKVFYNLLDNSIRHGGKVTEIRISSRHASDALSIIWEDNGEGIPHEEKDRICEHGFGKNNGFGLFLSCEILAITGLTLKETGEPGKGARFEISIPKGAYRITRPISK
jgi:PAS domain S-box-containing protein